jgi:4,5-dihydroxyphthalate decarboxylase
MATVENGVLNLRTNLAEYPVTSAIRDGRVTSDIVKLDCCGPDPAQGGFKDMLRRDMYDAGSPM